MKQFSIPFFRLYKISILNKHFIYIYIKCILQLAAFSLLLQIAFDRNKAPDSILV